MKTLNYIKLNESGVANVVSALHQLLADFQVYYTNLRGLHWNIKGHGFFVLHEKFESMYDDAAEKVDEIAERILMLGGVPENKFSEYLKVAKIKEVSDDDFDDDFDDESFDDDSFDDDEIFPEPSKDDRDYVSINITDTDDDPSVAEEETQETETPSEESDEKE